MLEMPLKPLTQLLSTKVKYAVLRDTHTLWVPYGWQVVLVPRVRGAISHVLFMPFVNSKMLDNSDINDAIVTFGCVAADSRARKMPNGKYASLKK